MRQASDSPLTVGLVHDQLLVNAGAEAVFREITSEFDGEIFCSVIDREKIPWLEGRKIRQTALARMPRSRSKHYLYSPIMLDVWRKARANKYDVILCDSHSFCHAIHGRPDAFKSVYYYTPARALWTPEIDDRANSGRLAPVKRALANRMRPIDHRAAQHWNWRIATSHTIAARVEKFYGHKCDAMVYPGVDVEKFAGVKRSGDDEGLLLWSRLIPYKRFDLLIDAAKTLGMKAHIVGAGPHRAQLEAYAGGSPLIHFHGRMSDEDLRGLLGRVKAVVFPSYEDFGIVPIEAMSAGVPVIVYDKGGASETVRENDGVRISEQTPEAVATAVRALDDRVLDPDDTRRHAQSFGNARFRKEYRAAVEEGARRFFGRDVDLPLPTS